MAFLVVVTPILGEFAYGPQYKFDPYGAGASLWLCLVLVWVGRKKRQYDIGVRAKRISKFNWKFSFRCKDVASEFDRLNQSLVAKNYASPPP